MLTFNCSTLAILQSARQVVSLNKKHFPHFQRVGQKAWTTRFSFSLKSRVALSNGILFFNNLQTSLIVPKVSDSNLTFFTSKYSFLNLRPFSLNYATLKMFMMEYTASCFQLQTLCSKISKMEETFLNVVFG